MYGGRGSSSEYSDSEEEGIIDDYTDSDWEGIPTGIDAINIMASG